MFPHSDSRSGASTAQMRDCRECPARKKERKHPFLQQTPESVCLASRDSAAMLITAMTPLFLEGGTACCHTVGEKQYQQRGGGRLGGRMGQANSDNGLRCSRS